MPKLEGKSALFGDLWATILNFFFSYFKSAPSNMSICKILRDNENASI